MTVILWLTFALAVISFAVSVAVVVVSLLIAGKARPIVQTYGPMLSAMMPAAAGTEPKIGSADSSPAATPDRCEYDDHEWSTPTPYADGVSTHYCKRCGYTEHVPGT